MVHPDVPVEIVLQDDLRKFAFGLVGNDSAADDLVQETMLRHYVRKRKRPDVSLWRWLQGILRNVLRDRIKYARRHRTVSLGALPSDPGVLDESPEDRWLGQDLALVLKRLPIKARAVLLRMAHGYRGSESAEVVGLSFAAVRKQKARALKRLRREFSPIVAAA